MLGARYKVANLEQNWNCRIPGFETSKVAKQRPSLSSHTSKISTVLKAKRDSELAKMSKIVGNF
jgi:transcription initiation factor TFIID subunit TAF12